jgi:hypothetical protein
MNPEDGVGKSPKGPGDGKALGIITTVLTSLAPRWSVMLSRWLHLASTWWPFFSQTENAITSQRRQTLV